MKPQPAPVLPRGRRQTLSPRDHYVAADQLLAELDDLPQHAFDAKLARAGVHAALAQCTCYDDAIDIAELDDPRERPDRLAVNCEHCHERIVFNRETGWHHKESGISDCFRDQQHTETATPERY